MAGNSGALGTTMVGVSSNVIHKNEVFPDQPFPCYTLHTPCTPEICAQTCGGGSSFCEEGPSRCCCPP